MKKLFCALSIAVSAAFVMTPAPAAAQSYYANTPEDYLVKTDNMQIWSVGLLFGTMEREIRIGKANETAKLRHYEAEVGVDVLPWLTLYGRGGASEFSLAKTPNYEDAEPTWGGGAHFRLLEHWIKDIGSLEDRFTIEGTVGYQSVESQLYNHDIEWDTTIAALTMSFVNETETDVDFFPEEVRLFAGPIYSKIDGTHHTFGDPKVEAKNDFGGLVGLEIEMTRHAHIMISTEIYNREMSADFGLIFNF